MRRLLVVLVAATALLWPTTAGAQTTIDDWWLTANGSAHCVLTGNHFMCERFDQYGNSGGYTRNDWLPAWCVVTTITSGDAAGTPMRIMIVAPLGWEAGCYPAYENSAYSGWQTGYGLYEGYASTSGWSTRTATAVPFRNPNVWNGVGTLVEIY